MKFRIITQPNCRYCTMAKEAIERADGGYVEEILGPETKAAFIAQGFTTVPQIWVHGTITRDITHIGGYTELVAYLDQHTPK